MVIGIVAVLVGGGVGYFRDDHATEAETDATQADIAEEVCRPLVQQALDRADDNESETEDLRERVNVLEERIDALELR